MPLYGNDYMSNGILHYNVFTQYLVTVLNVTVTNVLSKQIIYDFLNISAGVTELKQVWNVVRRSYQFVV